MARMRIASEDRPRVKLECLRMIATLKLDRARSTLIAGFVDSYLRLNAAEQTRLEQAVRAEMPADQQEVAVELMGNWEETGARRSQGRTIRRLLQRRFGDTPPDLESRIDRVPIDALEGFAEALLDFSTLADAEAWLVRNTPPDETTDTPGGEAAGQMP